ncbi:MULTISPECIES: cupin domain-containing protein [unclassified Haladaptatus]|uniref:cupin domain-containing protein n=1 Tax=unclassified Haladaptatus TaxID=2622732 RepID=UPI0023E8F773|nr:MULTISPECIES: cupin domain-containing protein [unclassified Haladaptatus]
MESVSLSDSEIVEAVDGVHLAQMAAGEKMSIQHFHIEPGASVPEHSHPHEQTGYVTKGTLTFLVGGEERSISAGESYVIPGDEPHGAENRGDVPVDGVDIFSPPRLDVPWLEG